MTVIMRAKTAARTREGFARVAPFWPLAAAVPDGAASLLLPLGEVGVAFGAPGSLVVVGCAMTDWRTEEGKKEMVLPAGSNTPLYATE